MTATASVSIGQFEQQLILSLDARQIRQIVIELHGMAERPYWRVNSKVRGHAVGRINNSAPKWLIYCRLCALHWDRRHHFMFHAKAMCDEKYIQYM